jgi:hypothetical protein
LTHQRTTDNIYSSIVSIKTIPIIMASAEINQLYIIYNDISFAYFEAYTQEKLQFIAGTEFGLLEGHLSVLDTDFEHLTHDFMIAIQISCEPLTSFHGSPRLIFGWLLSKPLQIPPGLC